MRATPGNTASSKGHGGGSSHGNHGSNKGNLRTAAPTIEIPKIAHNMQTKRDVERRVGELVQQGLNPD
jgi:hypothetical protein